MTMHRSQETDVCRSLNSLQLHRFRYASFTYLLFRDTVLRIMLCPFSYTTPAELQLENKTIDCPGEGCSSVKEKKLHHSSCALRPTQ